MKNFIYFFLLTTSISATYAQIGVNADNSAPHSSAMLDVKSTTKAFYPPRMTTVQKNAIIGPQVGAVVFDITLNQLSYYNGSTWTASSGSSFVLPYVGVFNTGLGGGYVLDIANSTGSDGSAIVGRNSTQISGEGILGIAAATAPLADVAGVYGRTASSNSNGVGVKALHAGTGSAFLGTSTNGIGASLLSTNGFALKTQGKLQFAGNGVGTLGSDKFLKSVDGLGNAEWADFLPFIYNSSVSNDLFRIINTSTGSNTSIYGSVNSLSGGTGVIGNAVNTAPTAHTYGVAGQNFSTNALGYGLFGYHAGAGIAGYFSSASGAALVTGTGNVGISITNPSEKLTVNGTSLTQGSVGGYRFNDRLDNNKGWQWYATGNSAHLFRHHAPNSNVLTINDAGNLGIGDDTPTLSGLVVDKVVGNAHAIFGSTTAGVSIESNWPGIGLNGYYSGGRRPLSAGFVGGLSMNPTTGLISIYNSAASGAAGAVVSGIDRFFINNVGNVGIGNSNPTASLYVMRGTGLNGTAAFEGTQWASHFNYSTAENTYIRGGKDNAKVLINDLGTNGPVQVGPSATPAGFKMSVDGKLICTELEVKVTPWPDYVFAKNYQLRPLPELEAFIEKNGHLPNIPKAEDIENQSLALGNMSKLQMEKIEEITLYMIEINKRLQNLEKENERLKTELAKAKNQ
jgi:hypothetical protein